jgi:hypothetical protein
METEADRRRTWPARPFLTRVGLALFRKEGLGRVAGVQRGENFDWSSGRLDGYFRL